MNDTIEAIRKRTDEAERVCREDGCDDPAHFGPRRDIRTLLAEIERLEESKKAPGREYLATTLQICSADAADLKAKLDAAKARGEEPPLVAVSTDRCQCGHRHAIDMDGL